MQDESTAKMYMKAGAEEEFKEISNEISHNTIAQKGNVKDCITYRVITLTTKPSKVFTRNIKKIKI